MTIKSKTEMYSLYHGGRFGNRLTTWANIDDWHCSGYALPVVMRYRGKGGGPCVYNVPRDQVFPTLTDWVKRLGLDPDLITLNEAASDSELILQGEVMRSTEYLSLRYSTVTSPMRTALDGSGRHIGGLAAVTMLKATLDPSSYDDLNSLLDDFPDSIVEFSTWSRDIGIMPRRNTVFWEVRNY